MLTKKEVLKQYLAALERENEAIENVRKLFAEKIRRVDSSFFEKLQDSTYDQDDVFEWKQMLHVIIWMRLSIEEFC